MSGSLAASTRPARRAKARAPRRRSRVRANGYVAGSLTKRSLSGWPVTFGDADSDTLTSLPILRARSRDLYRNNSIARGAIDTLVLNIVGPGLKFQARIDSDLLGLSDSAHEAWERDVEHRWRMFAESVDCDARRTLNFYGLQRLFMTTALVAGEGLATLPVIVRKGLSDLAVQLVEPDRLETPPHLIGEDRVKGGIEANSHGAPIAYHIRTGHPGIWSDQMNEWRRVLAYGRKSGRQNVIHMFNPERPGQRRGVPLLATITDKLKQIGRYDESELYAAVISSYYTIFVKNNNEDSDDEGEGGSLYGGDEDGPFHSEDPLEMQQGGVVELSEGQSIETANPGRPNAQYGPFRDAVMKDIGMGLTLPYEVLRKHYQSSYSASRGATLDALKVYLFHRSGLAFYFNQRVYEAWLTEQVLKGHVNAPGFLTDPYKRKAWCGSKWIGPAQGQLDPVKELIAAQMRVASAYSTNADETALLTGGDWDQNVRQRKKEIATFTGEAAQGAAPKARRTSRAQSGLELDLFADYAAHVLRQGVYSIDDPQ